MKLVRLKPLDKAQGFVKRRYTDVALGLTFDVDVGWYEVEDSVAKALAEVPQRSDRLRGPKAFDIVNDAKEAKELIESLKRKDEVELGTIEAPISLVRPGRREEKPSKKKAGKKKARTRTARNG